MQNMHSTHGETEICYFMKIANKLKATMRIKIKLSLLVETRDRNAMNCGGD